MNVLVESNKFLIKLKNKVGEVFTKTDYDEILHIIDKLMQENNFWFEEARSLALIDDDNDFQ